MPVSLLTPIAHDLRATEGMAGQAISISGLFAVGMSLLIATIAGRFDRRHVLIALTAIMLMSLVLIAVAPNFLVLMAARALLGLVIGGFWSLATATVMRLVPAGIGPESIRHRVHRKCSGDGLRSADWELPRRHHRMARRVLGPRADCSSDPHLAVDQPASMPPQAANPVSKVFALLKRRNVVVRHARSHVDLRGRVRHLHLPSAIP